MYNALPQPPQDNDYVTVSDGKYGKYKVLRETPKKNTSVASGSDSNVKAALLEESVGLIPRVFKDIILKVSRNNGSECDTKCVLSFYEI